MRWVAYALWTVMLILVGAAPSIAQGIELGVKGGVNMTTVSNVSEITDTRDSDASRRFGPMLGGFVNIALGASRFSIQPEALVTWKGASLDDGDEMLRLTYLDIPLLMKLIAPPGGDEKALYVIAGPNVGVRLNANVEDNGEQDDVGDLLKSTDFGFTVGGGLQARRWLVEGRYTQGLGGIAVDSRDTVKTRTIAVAVGIRF